MQLVFGTLFKYFWPPAASQPTRWQLWLRYAGIKQQSLDMHDPVLLSLHYCLPLCSA